MAYARRNDSFGGGSRGGHKFGGAPRGRGFSDRSEARPMYPATCSDCGISCEVPFRPNGKKPVLCKSCFAQGDNFEPKFASRRDSERSTGGDDTAAQLRSINVKLDAIMRTLESSNLAE